MHFRGVSGDTSKDDGRSEVDESGKVLRGVSGDTSTDTEDIVVVGTQQGTSFVCINGFFQSPLG